MSKSSKKNRLQKPRPDFPLFVHDSLHHDRARWCKKVRGQLVYFGRVLPDDRDGQKALARWLDTKDDLLAGRRPRGKTGELTVEELANQFLDSKKARVASGELSGRTWRDYQRLLVLVVESLGRNRLAADIKPDEWGKLRAAFAAKWGPVRLGNSIVYVRSVWKWGWDNLGMDPMRFGSSFDKPSAKILRANKNSNGDRTFKPEDVHAILGVASANAKAALLLGLNCGYGTGDVAGLPLAALDLENGWAVFPRSKTAVPRRCPLWLETIEAIKDAIAKRPRPQAGSENFVFLRASGRRNTVPQMSHDLTAAFLAAGVTDKTFYDARRTFQTIGETSKDFPAVSAIMGHIAGASDMSAVYRQRVDDSRLQAVVTVVHDWLFGTAEQA